MCPIPCNNPYQIPFMATAMIIPSMAPMRTCKGVCPTSSFSFASGLISFPILRKISSISFKTRPCLPVSLRTPMASYITIMASITVTANSITDCGRRHHSTYRRRMGTGHPPASYHPLHQKFFVDDEMYQSFQYLGDQPPKGGRHKNPVLKYISDKIHAQPHKLS